MSPPHHAQYLQVGDVNCQLTLIILQHTIMVMDTVIITASISLSDASVHMYHPIIPLNIKHIMKTCRYMDIRKPSSHISSRYISSSLHQYIIITYTAWPNIPPHSEQYYIPYDIAGVYHIRDIISSPSMSQPTYLFSICTIHTTWIRQQYIPW